MIHIDRTPRPAIPVFTAATVPDENGILVTKAEAEIAEARRFYVALAANGGGGSTGSYGFKVYKDEELSAALEALFGTKCAYCETDFGPSAPKEVEHFRPKSEIGSGKSKLKPGYYWLANDWTNLLLSCIDCNRRRRHRVPGQPKKVTLGKEAQFPVSDESRRYRGPGPGNGDEEAVRLLLDPCVDEPSEHLTFDDVGLIYAKEDMAGVTSAKGEQSIFVYALQRMELVRDRKVATNLLAFNVNELRGLIVVLSTGVGEPGKSQLEQMRDAKADFIRQMFRPEAEYLGALRDWVRRETAAGRLDTLVQAGIDLAALT
jgi:uncharacterized protein (TIGR02646 family)